MHILILNWRDPKNPKSGGAEYVTMQHAKAWVRVGHKVTWFTSKFDGSKDIDTIGGVEIIRKGSSLMVHMYAAFFYLSSSKKFDIVVDEIHGIPFFTPLYVRKPIVAFIHEVAGDIWDAMYPFPINILGKFIESSYFFLYKSILFWTDSPSTINELVTKKIPRKNCFAIPCPIDTKVIKYLPRKEKNPTYIFVSRIVKMKGIENIIQAFALIQKKQAVAKLWIVGDGDPSYIKKLKTKILDIEKQNKHANFARFVIFWGWVSEKKKLILMRKAHVLLHASMKEGWGLVVLEAASQGTPSIVYDVTGLRDSVKNNKTGIVLQENSSEEMANMANNLINDKILYRKLQKNGIKWVNSITWNEATKKSLLLLKQAL